MTEDELDEDFLLRFGDKIEGLAQVIVDILDRADKQDWNRLCQVLDKMVKGGAYALANMYEEHMTDGHITTH